MTRRSESKLNNAVIIAIVCTSEGIQTGKVEHNPTSTSTNSGHSYAVYSVEMAMMDSHACAIANYVKFEEASVNACGCDAINLSTDWFDSSYVSRCISESIQNSHMLCLCLGSAKPPHHIEH